MRVTRRVWVILLALAAVTPAYAGPVPGLDELAGEWQAVDRLEQMPPLPMGGATELVGKVVDVKVGGRRYDVVSDGEGVRAVVR